MLKDFLGAAAIALVLAVLLQLPAADAALLMVLSASASYIVVPAVLRHAVPEAQPGLYLGLSLGVTFPLNILLGIPLYTGLAQATLGMRPLQPQLAWARACYWLL